MYKSNLKNNKKISGFTLIELLIVISITAALASISLPIWSNLQLGTQARETSARLTQTLMQARQQAIAGQDNANYGVFLNLNTDLPRTFILYQGNSYATRDPSFDGVFTFDGAINASTTFTENDINFSIGTGLPSSSGIISLLQDDKEVKKITINNLGIALEE